VELAVVKVLILNCRLVVLLFRANQLPDRANELDGSFLAEQCAVGSG
jgi:hypothetical protein